MTVREVNRPPVLTVPADQRLFEETALAVSVSATDPDIPANALTFSLLSPPEGMTIDAASGAITWTPTEAQGSNTYTITAVVTDDSPAAVNERHLSATNSFIVIVDETNAAPVLAPLADQTLHAGLTFSRTATATDKDIPTNILSFSLLSAPADMTITSEGGVITWPTSDTQANSTNSVWCKWPITASRTWLPRKALPSSWFRDRRWLTSGSSRSKRWSPTSTKLLRWRANSPRILK